MKKLAIALVVLLLVILLGIGGTLLFSKKAPVPAPVNTGDPFASTTSTTNNDFKLSIMATDGTSYTIPDVTKGKPADVLGSSTYYHLTNNQDTQGENAQFEIQYGTDNSISIVLLKEPLKDARLSAEATLRSLFQLSNDTLCTLDVFVAAPSNLNDAYSGNNLGLSFCKGSVLLP